MYKLSWIDEEGVFLGNLPAATNLWLLQRMGITHIVIAGTGMQKYHPEEIVYKQLYIIDAPNENLFRFFEDWNDFIEAVLLVGGKVLIHWTMGYSRSPALGIAWIMYRQQKSFLDAFDCVQDKHSTTHPNNGFQQQLELYDRQLNGELVEYKENENL